MKDLKEDIELFDHFNSLYALYKNLLTKRQILIADQYFVYDLSETEISKELQITRNAVHDTISKIVNKLVAFENKLGLYQKFLKVKRFVDASELNEDEKQELMETMFYGI